MRHLEGEPCGAEVVVAIAELGIDQRLADGATIGGQFMVIHDDHVHAVTCERFHLSERGGAAVEREHEVRFAELLEHTSDAVLAHAIAFLHAMREEELGIESIRLEREMDDGHRGYAIHIVVAVEHHVFMTIHSLEDALHGRIHLGEIEGIGERGQLGIEEVVHRFLMQVPALSEELCDQRSQGPSGHRSACRRDRGLEHPGSAWK